MGTIYWFVSYEFVGTVMLLGFGLATGLAFIILFRRDRKVRATRAADGSMTATPSVAVPGPTGRSVTSRGRCHAQRGAAHRRVRDRGDRAGGAFGPWFAITGLVPVLIGAADWLRAANRELDQRSEADGIVQPDR